MRKKRKKRYSGIGGQAVLEGIMMQNNDKYAVAVRKPDNTIEVIEKSVDFPIDSGVKKIPFIRGIFQFIDSLALGMSALNISSEVLEGQSTPKGLDKLLVKIFGKNAAAVASVISVLISGVFALALFVVAPYFLSEFLSGLLCNRAILAIVEGLIRFAIFIGYLLIISLFKDVRRNFAYHGAEHKCINCLETGKELTVKNVMRQSRKHNRCGTSFIILAIVITVILFFFISVDTLWLKVLLRIVLIPVVAGIAYELLKFTGKHNNRFVKIISAPGMWIQSITTKEPTEDMVEVAIKATEAVFDWKAFLEESFGYEFEEEGILIGGDSSNTVSIKREDIEKRLAEAISADDIEKHMEDAIAQSSDIIKQLAEAQSYTRKIPLEDIEKALNNAGQSMPPITNKVEELKKEATEEAAELKEEIQEDVEEETKEENTSVNEEDSED